MGADRFDDLLAHARELEQRDADVAVRLEEVSRLLALVDETRRCASETRGALDAIPEEIESLREEERLAQARAAEARQTLAEEEERLAAVGRSRRVGEDARTAAERAVRRATVAAADASGTVARMQDRLRGLAAEQVVLRSRADGIAVEARVTAAAVAEVPRLSDSGRATPAAGLDEIEEWGARAHAALFVVRGGLESERERLVVEANTLAASALGEQLAGTNVTLVRKRLEQAGGD